MTQIRNYAKGLPPRKLKPRETKEQRDKRIETNNRRRRERYQREIDWRQLAKPCPGCETLIHPDSFNPDRTAKDGLQPICKGCQAKEQLAHRRKNQVLQRRRPGAVKPETAAEIIERMEREWEALFG